MSQLPGCVGFRSACGLILNRMSWGLTQSGSDVLAADDNRIAFGFFDHDLVTVTFEQRSHPLGAGVVVDRAAGLVGNALSPPGRTVLVAAQDHPVNLLGHFAEHVV